MIKTEQLRSRGTRVIAAVVAAGALAVPAAALGDNPTLSIEAQSIGFFGYLHSNKSDCESGRTVKLFKVKHSGKQLIGTDEAQPNGPDSMWSINTNKSGKFYAKVAATDTCSKVVSETIHSES
jgi:hypothetical protein